MSGVATDKAPLEGKVLGRYLLVRLLGEGGMGVVYEATHQDLGKRVAIKTLHQRLADSPDTRSRFLREGRTASRIRHPNVADVYDVGIEESHPYLVMEFLEGEDLARLIAREAPLSVQRTADILVPVVAAVAAAHELGVVHRDLKPANIFLSAERNTIKPKVLDFGISKVTDREDPSTLTKSGTILGTPFYLSPEQAEGKRADVRSDQYALGVILYECVTARPPIEELALYRLMQRIVHGDFAPPRQINPALPSAFEEMILRAMKRDPEQRFPTTQSLGCALLAFSSELVRATYAQELQHHPAATVAVDRPLALETTLNAQLGSRPTAAGEELPREPPPALKRAVWPAILAVLVATALGVIVLRSGWGVRRVQGPQGLGSSGVPASGSGAAVPMVAEPPLRMRMLTAVPADNAIWDIDMSADGTHYVYQNGSGVWLGNVEGGAPRRLKHVKSDWRQSRIALMPDGVTIAIERESAPDASGERSEIRRIALVPLEAGNERILSVSGPAARIASACCRSLRSSPDGREIALGATGALLAVDVNSGRTRLVTAVGERNNVAAIAWSPDGSHLAFVSGEGFRLSELAVVQADGHGKRQLLVDAPLYDNAYGAGVAWLSERRLAFSRLNDPGEPPGAAIWEIDVGDPSAAPGAPRLVHRWLRQFPDRLTLSRVSGRLLTVLGRTQRAIYVGELRAGSRQPANVARLTLDESDDWLGGWLADGRLLFMSDRYGNWDVLAQAPGSAEADVLAGSPQWETVPGIVGNSFAFWRIDPGPTPGPHLAELVRIDDSGSLKHVLERHMISEGARSNPPPLGSWGFGCTRAENPVCVLGEWNSRGLELRRFDPGTGGIEKSFYQRAGKMVAWKLAPDGRSVAMVSPGNASLVLVSTATGEAREIHLEDASWESAQWLPDGRGLMLAGRGFRDHQYFIVRTDLHGKLDLIQTSETSYLFAPMVSLDGTRAAYNAQTFERNIQLIEGW